MAKRTPKEESRPTRAGDLIVPRLDAIARIEERARMGNELISRGISSQEELKVFESDVSRWNRFNTDLLKALFDNEYLADEYEGTVVSFSYMASGAQRVADVKESVRRHTEALDSILERMVLFKERSPSVGTSAQVESGAALGGKRVFVVHGHDVAALSAVTSLLRQLKLEPIVLHEKENQGKTLIEKLETHAEVAFAVVLLTPDDHGAADKDEFTDVINDLKPRARQNVVFELGYFFGRLNRSRVAALYAHGVEQPSDIQGLVYIELDDREAWKMKLARELKAAGLPVNANDLI